MTARPPRPRSGLAGRTPLCVGLRTQPLLRLPGADSGDPLGVRHLQLGLGPRPVVKVRHGYSRQSLPDGALDTAQVSLFFR